LLNEDEIQVSISAFCENVQSADLDFGVIETWIENDDFVSVTHSELFGHESGNTIADILYGDGNPSGELPITS
jgi:hypothetical protein